eukprot:14192486-Alexandrium_andersonii.AAC.1
MLLLSVLFLAAPCQAPYTHNPRQPAACAPKGAARPQTSAVVGAYRPHWQALCGAVLLGTWEGSSW